MVRNWREFYRDHRSEAIIKVTQALRPECKTRLEIQKVIVPAPLVRQTFLTAYKNLANIEVSPTLFEDRLLLTCLDALARIDKALPAIYSLILEGGSIYYTTAQIVDGCAVAESRVRTLLEKLKEYGLIGFQPVSQGIYKVACEDLSGPRVSKIKEIPTSTYIRVKPVFKGDTEQDATNHLLSNTYTNNSSSISNQVLAGISVILDTCDESTGQSITDPQVQDMTRDEPPTEDAHLKDKVIWIVDLWNWFASLPDRNVPRFPGVPPYFVSTGEIRRKDRVLRAIADWIVKYEWNDCVRDWQSFLEAADTNTFIKMVPHKDRTKTVFSGVTLGWIFGSEGDTPGLVRFEEGKYTGYDENFEVSEQFDSGYLVPRKAPKLQAPVKDSIQEIIGDYNAHMLTIGGTFFTPTEAFSTYGTITDTDHTLRLLRDFILGNHYWRAKWRKGKLRSLKEGKLTCNSLDELFKKTN
jgi:hypothetical protein